MNIKSINDGKPLANPYGKVSSIPPSFANVDYYDCYVPYGITCQQLGGYSIKELHDGGDTYPPMANAIKGQKVANHPASRGSYKYGDFSSATAESKTHCYQLTWNDSTGIATKFYLTAVQPFFLRRSVGTGTPTNGYFPYSTANRGQLIDVILTDGTCIHFILNDVNSVPHTNCGNNQAGSSQYATTRYNQYQNIISCVGGNSLEISHDGDATTAMNAFSAKYGLGTWGKNGGTDIAFYRVYNAKVTTGFKLANNLYSQVSYRIVDPTDVDPGEGGSSGRGTNPPVVDLTPGIQGLVINYDIWKNGTHLIRPGDFVILRAEKSSSGRVTWYDITNKKTPIPYTPLQLKSKFGISYTRVNNMYEGKFLVRRKPLPVELGGTGASNLMELAASILGTNDAPGGYDYSGTTMPTIDTVNKINPPTLLKGHCTTAEARSSSRGGMGSPNIGDQAQAKKTKYYDDQGEVSIIYDRNVSEFTALYRLVGTNAQDSAKAKVIALSAANHAWFLANNSVFGYNFYDNGYEAIWNYLSACKQQNAYVLFGNFTKLSDTNCINFCRLVYAASLKWSNSNKATLAKHWTTDGVLESNTLESLGFKKFGASYAKDPSNFEIGDILLKSGHAALVVDVGGKSWFANGQDFSPKNGEVKT